MVSGRYAPVPRICTPVNVANGLRAEAHTAAVVAPAEALARAALQPARWQSTRPQSPPIYLMPWSLHERLFDEAGHVPDGFAQAPPTGDVRRESSETRTDHYTISTTDSQGFLGPRDPGGIGKLRAIKRSPFRGSGCAAASSPPRRESRMRIQRGSSGISIQVRCACDWRTASAITWARSPS